MEAGIVHNAMPSTKAGRGKRMAHGDQLTVFQFSSPEENFQRLFTVLDSLDAVVYVADIATNELIFLNRKSMNDVGVDQNAIGRKCWEVLQRDQTGPCPFCTNDKIVDQNGKPKDVHIWEFQNTSNGRWYYIQDRAIHWPDGRLVRLEIATDITERKQNELALLKRDAILEAMNWASERFLAEGYWHKHIPEFLKRLGKATDVSRVHVFKNYYAQDGSERMTPLVEWGAKGVQRKIGKTKFLDIGYEEAGAGRWKKRFLKHKMIAGNVIEFPKKERNLLEQQDIISLAAAPIYLDGHWWGFIGLDECRTERDWSSAELDALQTAASILSAALKRHTIEKDLRTLTLKAEESSQAKSEFLANMSHEIRTPLNGVLSMLQLLACTELSTEQLEYIQNAETAGKSLLEIINDILDLSKIEAGKMEIEPSSFQLSKMLSSVANIFNQQLKDKDITLSWGIESGTPEWLLGDAGRIRQILFNLMGNAVKFTHKGSIRVEALARPDPVVDKSIQLNITVSDTGIGIPKDKLAVIFEPFTQVEGALTRRFTGTGLGLAIVKRLVDLMHGAISITSTVNKGTSIRFNVSVRPGTAPDHMGDVCIVPEFSVSKRYSILLAEDNPVNRLAASRFLEKAGHNVTSVNDGQKVLEELQVNDYDCVIMDIQMPTMDGLETLQAIRDGKGGEAHRKIPVVALTAHAMRGDRESIIQAGFNDYLAKPVDMDTLLISIANQLHDEKKSE